MGLVTKVYMFNCLGTSRYSILEMVRYYLHDLLKACFV